MMMGIHPCLCLFLRSWANLITMYWSWRTCSQRTTFRPLWEYPRRQDAIRCLTGSFVHQATSGKTREGKDATKNTKNPVEPENIYCHDFPHSPPLASLTPAMGSINYFSCLDGQQMRRDRTHLPPNSGTANNTA